MFRLTVGDLGLNTHRVCSFYSSSISDWCPLRYGALRWCASHSRLITDAHTMNLSPVPNPLLDGGIEAIPSPCIKQSERPLAGIQL